MGQACDLTNRKCVPCQGGVVPLKGQQLYALRSQLGEGWDLVNEHHLEKTFSFKDFKEALAFVNRVGELAEAEGHHPNINFTWGRATLTIYSHKINGLHENDFILAAKADQCAGA